MTDERGGPEDYAEEGKKGNESMTEAMADPQRPTRVLIIDDHAVVRAGLRMLLEVSFGYEVIEAASAMEGVVLVRRDKPDVVLVDARMPEQDGIWAIKEIRRQSPDLPLIMLSTYDTEAYVNGALDAGASGYLLKEASSEQLRDAIDTALTKSGVYLYPSVAAKLLARGRARARAEETLTPREHEILAELAQGSPNAEIARKLFLSEKTVKSHTSSIFRKLGVSNRTEAVARALADGLVRTES